MELHEYTNLLINLIDLTIIRVEEAEKEFHWQHSSYREIEDFRTLSIKPPRGFGVTSVALNILEKYNSVLFVPTNSIIRHVHDLKIKHSLIYDDRRVININDALECCNRVLHFDIAIFDPASLICAKPKYDLADLKYQMLLDNTVKLFVMLG